ncbi:MAG: TIGR03936 family radical SAM-associated protein [Oscillospiraceae bacterium]|nr:TIGR03936 family radical SAM-associated protein [Oscillospiraceae bacterium]
MPRLLFEKKGRAIWISHLDLMRVFQRAFKRAGLPLTHTHGFNPRPSVSIALPLSVGVESTCELLDFDLEGDSFDLDEVLHQLNDTLIEGIEVLKVYDSGRKLRDLTYLHCQVDLIYDNNIPDLGQEKIKNLFQEKEIIVAKKGKKGLQDQDIIPMIRECNVHGEDNKLVLDCIVCCQNPSLNPMLLASAVEKYLPDIKPDFAAFRRIEIFDETMTVFR